MNLEIYHDKRTRILPRYLNSCQVFILHKIILKLNWAKSEKTVLCFICGIRLDLEQGKITFVTQCQGRNQGGLRGLKTPLAWPKLRKKISF